ncbi:MAG: methyltransferase [Pseudomonadota bacterium]
MISPALLRLAHLPLGILLAFVWGLFAAAHLSAFERTQHWSYLFFGVAETLQALLFLVRSEARTVSGSALDWLAAVGGTLAPLAFTPAAWGVLPGAELLLIVGCCLQMAGLASLNRSFGLVAARREIKTGGLYRLVRHPLYASYLLSFSGYVLANTSATNIAVYVAALGLLLARLLREEQHLAKEAAYRAYMNQVKFRIIPYVL